MNIGIIGLGLMGGSLARDATAAGWKVSGADRDPETLRAAMASGVVRDSLDPRAGRLDLIVIAVPVRSAVEVVRDLADRIPADAPVAVTDVGSTKRSIAEAAAAVGLGARFVGGHPMAGDHRSGWGAARPGLFRDATVWLCPAPGAERWAVSRVEALWSAVGGRPARIDAAEHDRRLAHASHLPQVTASALAATLAGAELTLADLGPGGRDATRLAESDPAMWTDILTDNADQVRPALRRLLGRLRRLDDHLERQDAVAIRSWLETSRLPIAGPGPGPANGSGR